jgi:hypothetical protein|tara:strand:+ start:230 stop:631 length:402 start_codon:yes stop_codon:yes gene_type:complete
VKTFFKIQFLSLSFFFGLITLLIFFLPNVVYDFYSFDAESVNEIGRNQIRTDTGGVWLLVAVLPILFLTTKNDYFIDVMILFFIVATVARGISFLTGDGYHFITIALFAGEIYWIVLLLYFKQKFPNGSFFIK